MYAYMKTQKEDNAHYYFTFYWTFHNRI